MKINASTKSLVERLCDLKICAISVLSFIGSVCAPDQATLKAENHAFQCIPAGPHNAITSELLEVGSVCGLDPDLVGIRSISLAARYRVAACSSKFLRGLEMIGTARGHNGTPLFALSPAWEHEFLIASMALNTADAFDIVFLLDRDDTFDEVPQNKNRKLPLGYFRSHFGSRAILVQVNIVAVSDHVFHRFLVDLLIQVSATQVPLFLCILFRFDVYQSRK